MDDFFYKSMIVTLISFMLLNAFTHPTWRDYRKVFLVSETLMFFLINQSRLTPEQRSLTYRYITFGVTFMFLYFWHTHEYVGDDGTP